MSDGGRGRGWVVGGRDGRCGWSVVERIGSGKGWCGTVRMVATSWKSRARRGWLAGERVKHLRDRVEGNYGSGRSELEEGLRREEGNGGCEG
ncbi:hypothetical protein ALC53_04912 [Atta colombica]|uniref:Uncharacterized protein n=1 Tax=Atta colombica TaxID=520822 RepID=A0A195BJ37_9HYME|nr:hypothetical protein ALC53_04912 [Atta colombica]